MCYLKFNFSINPIVLHFTKVPVYDEVEIGKTWPFTKESLRSTVSGVDIRNLCF